MIDEIKRRREKIRKIMRRNIGGNKERDERRKVWKKVGKREGKKDGLLVLIIIGRKEINGVLVDELKKKSRKLSNERLGVENGGGVIEVDIEEIEMKVKERIEKGEIMREKKKRIIDRGIEMGMEIENEIEKDKGEFRIRMIGIKKKEENGVNDEEVKRI